MFHQSLIHSRGKFTIIMTTSVVGTFTVSNSEPFHMVGFVPGSFIDRPAVLITHIKHFVDR